MNKTLIAIASVMLMSCASSKKSSIPSEPSLFQKWDLVTLHNDSITSGNHKTIYIEFSDSANRVGGSGPCNRYFSTFSKSGNQLKFSMIGSTKMACIDDQANWLEQNFFQTLEKVTAYKFENGYLHLMSDDNTVATFVARQSVPDDLVGKWEMFYITGRKIAFEGLYPDRKPSLTFTAGTNEISGFTSCNSMSATYLGVKNKPLFKPGAMTLMACPGEGELVFLDAFHKVDTYAVSSDTLTFYNNSIPIMKFKRSDDSQ